MIVMLEFEMLDSLVFEPFFMTLTVRSKMFVIAPPKEFQRFIKSNTAKIGLRRHIRVPLKELQLRQQR